MAASASQRLCRGRGSRTARIRAITGCATGIQVVAPGCYIREHVHPAQDEILFVFEGDGEAVIDGASHPMPRGTTVYIGAGHRHKLVNGSPDRRSSSAG